MGTINDRIAECVAESGLTKTEFANRVNLSQPHISKITLGESSPSDRTIADICREFNVSEVWLRTGEGTMFNQLSEDAEFNRILVEIQFSGDEFIKRLIRLNWGLGDKEKAIIRQLINDLADKEKSPGN